MIIPKENLAGYQRWKVDSFDQPARQEVSGDAPATAQAPAPRETTETVVEMPFPTADELSRINEKARDEGYRAGYAEGRQAGEAEFIRQTEEKLNQLCSIIGNLQVSLAHIDQHVGDQLLDLGLEIAAQVVHGSLSVKRELLLPIIREAMGELPLHHGTISLHLNPDDAESLGEALRDQLAHTGAHIVADQSISAGGCHLKAGNSDIDATMETRWRRVLEAIGIKASEWMTPP